MGSNHQKGKKDFGKFKSGGREDLKKKFLQRRRTLEVDCPKLKPKESKSEDNITQTHNGNYSGSSGYSLSITHIGCCLDKSE